MRPSATAAGRALAAAGLGVALLAAAAGCGASSPSRSLGATAGLPSTSPIGPSPTGGGSLGVGASPAASRSAVAVDPSLLRFVPLGGDGVDLTFDPDTTASVAADPGLAADISSLAIGLYTRRSAGASASPSGDLVIVNVANLRDSTQDENWFRDWRESYDRAACANAGGVVRHAETTIGATRFFVGSCAGGSFTYHVRLRDVGMVVSMTSIGSGRLGEEIVRRMAP